MKTSQQHALSMGLGLLLLSNYEMRHLELQEFEAEVALDKDISVAQIQRDVLEANGWVEDTAHSEVNFWSYEV
jgi:hypothetical protein